MLAFILAPLVGRRYGYNFSDVILWLTGIVLVAYTLETREMRQAMVRANTMAVQPLLVAVIGDRPVGRGSGEQLWIKNIGKGAAIDVTIDDIIHDPPVLISRFAGESFVESGQRAPFSAEFGVVENDVFKGDDWIASLNPRTARENYELLIHYEDVDARRYRSVVRMGRDGVRLIDVHRMA